MAVPRRPHQPRASRTTRATRTTTHAATRAPQCTSHCSLRPLHKRLHLLQAPYRTGARRARQDASPRGARGGTPRAQATEHALRYPSRAAVQVACSLHSSPACSEPFSPRAPLRPCRLAPARRRSCTARGARVARCARAPPSVQCAVQSACTQRRAHARNPRYMCTPRSPRTAIQPAPRDSRLPHVEPAPAARSTVRTVVSLSQKENKKSISKTKTSTPPKKNLQTNTKNILHHARRARTHAPAHALIRSVFCTACQPACTHSIQHHQPACSTLRPCRLAPVCTARGARAARCAHARPHERARALNRSLLHRPPACLHTQHTAPWARIRLTTQPAPASRLTTPSRAHTASSPIGETAARASAHACSFSCILRPSQSTPQPRLPGHTHTAAMKM